MARSPPAGLAHPFRPLEGVQRKGNKLDHKVLGSPSPLPSCRINNRDEMKLMEVLEEICLAIHFQSSKLLICTERSFCCPY